MTQFNPIAKAVLKDMIDCLKTTDSPEVLRTQFLNESSRFVDKLHAHERSLQSIPVTDGKETLQRARFVACIQDFSGGIVSLRSSVARNNDLTARVHLAQMRRAGVLIQSLLTDPRSLDYEWQ